MQAEIGQNILTVKNKIYAACEAIKKDHNEITLIAVSKKKDNLALYRSNTIK
jgi:uncharacterized pyridoxal phosphate-containing UPF0001 family protein